MFGESLGELGCLAGAFTEIIEFGASCHAASHRFDINDCGGVEREDSLDAFIVDDAADGEGFVDASAFAGDNCAVKDLRPLLVAFFDAAIDVHCVAYFEVR